MKKKDTVKFLICIPCYNCLETIGRLLSSMEKQHYSKLVVVICDDSDNDELSLNIFDIKKKYQSITIDYYKREDSYEYHCPGNTRNSLLKRALNYYNSDYIMFADNDDILEFDILQTVSDFIVDNAQPEVVVTNFNEWDETKHAYLSEITGNTWLHGKFYKTEFLKKFNINFKMELYTHEDLYFNCTVDSMIESMNLRKMYLSLNTYKWVYNENSLSRRGFREGQHCFIEKYLNDYIHAASDPFIKAAFVTKEYGPIAYRRCIDTLLYAYFYYQGALYRMNGNILPSCKDSIQSYIYRLMKTFNISKNDVISLVYASPAEYMEKKQYSFMGVGPYIESESFGDFLLRI